MRTLNRFRYTVVCDRVVFGVSGNWGDPWPISGQQGWISYNDARAMKRINMIRAVGRARAKLTVLEFNALALYISKQK